MPCSLVHRFVLLDLCRSPVLVSASRISCNLVHGNDRIVLSREIGVSTKVQVQSTLLGIGLSAVTNPYSLAVAIRVLANGCLGTLLIINNARRICNFRPLPTPSLALRVNAGIQSNTGAVESTVHTV